MIKKRVTLRDIASASGYHFSTVSLALRGSSSIPDATRIRIKKIATEMGYSPDPVLSALVAYRQERTAPDYGGTIVWLTDSSGGIKWRDVAQNVEYYRGAEREAKQRGFKLEELDLGSSRINPCRASQILRTRRINCLLIPPQPHADLQRQMVWKDFHAVALEYGAISSHLPVVASNHSSMMVELLQRLQRLGYRRPGLVLSGQTNVQVESKWASAYLGEVFRQDWLRSMVPLCMDTWSSEMYDRWFYAQQPDVLIGCNLTNPQLLPHLQNIGVRVAEDIGYADISLDEGDTDHAGMKPHAEKVGEIAVAKLISLFHRNEYADHSEIGIHTLIDGSWHTGPSIRPQSRYFHEDLVEDDACSSKPGWEMRDQVEARRLCLKSG
jgi:DNA-binding LacI/PurR family transcriptional regulator